MLRNHFPKFWRGDMPKRVIDFDAMWGSDKLAACAEWAQAEYAWLYGLADASGCFELTNLRVIWGRVAAIRRNLSIERLEQIFGEFQDKGLLFAWEHEGKRYGHWTGSDVPGRLPPPSWRMRLERLAPPVPKQALAEYVSRFARGRAGLQGGAFVTEGRGGEAYGGRGNSGSGGAERQGEGNLKFEISDLKQNRLALRNQQGEISDFIESHAGRGSRLSGLNDGVEAGQGQDWDGDLNWEGRRDRKLGAAAGSATDLEMERREMRGGQTLSSPSNPDSASNLKSQSCSISQSRSVSDSISDLRSSSQPSSALPPNPHLSFDLHSNSGTRPNSGIASGDGRAGASRAGERAGENCSTVERGGASRSGSSGNDEIAEVYRGDHAVAANASHGFRRRDKAEIVAGELMVGRGPVCGPVRIKPEALERIRQRNASRDRTRSP
jgi:hypothetical protein